MHKVVLVICAKRLWNHTDSERAMLLNCCCFLIVCLFVCFYVYKALNIMNIEKYEEYMNMKKI